MFGYGMHFCQPKCQQCGQFLGSHATYHVCRCQQCGEDLMGGYRTHVCQPKCQQCGGVLSLFGAYHVCKCQRCGESIASTCTMHACRSEPKQGFWVHSSAVGALASDAYLLKPSANQIGALTAGIEIAGVGTIPFGADSLGIALPSTKVMGSVAPGEGYWGDGNALGSLTSVYQAAREGTSFLFADQYSRVGLTDPGPVVVDCIGSLRGVLRFDSVFGSQASNNLAANACAIVSSTTNQYMVGERSLIDDVFAGPAEIRVGPWTCEGMVGAQVSDAYLLKPSANQLGSLTSGIHISGTDTVSVGASSYAGLPQSDAMVGGMVTALATDAYLLNPFANQIGPGTFPLAPNSYMGVTHSGAMVVDPAAAAMRVAWRFDDSQGYVVSAFRDSGTETIPPPSGSYMGTFQSGTIVTDPMSTLKGTFEIGGMPGSLVTLLNGAGVQTFPLGVGVETVFTHRKVAPFSPPDPREELRLPELTRSSRWIVVEGREIDEDWLAQVQSLVHSRATVRDTRLTKVIKCCHKAVAFESHAYAESPEVESEHIEMLEVAILELCKAVTALTGEIRPGRHAARHVRVALGLPERFFHERVIPLVHARDDYDVAHFRLSGTPQSVLLSVIEEAKKTVLVVVAAYCAHLNRGGVPLEQARRELKRRAGLTTNGVAAGMNLLFGN